MDVAHDGSVGSGILVCTTRNENHQRRLGVPKTCGYGMDISQYPSHV